MVAAAIVASSRRFPAEEVPLHDADLLEIRLDAGEVTLEEIGNVVSPLPMILTDRRPTGDVEVQDELKRLERLQSATQLDAVWGVDIELEVFTNQVDERVTDAARRLRRVASDNGTMVICSHHDWDGTLSRDELVDLAQMTTQYGDISKIAVMAETPTVLGRFVAATVEVTGMNQAITMMTTGPFALISRVVAMERGCSPVYGSLDSEPPTAPGQPTVGQLRALLNALNSDG